MAAKDWIDQTSESSEQINVASLVTAAALETYAVTDYDYLEELDLYFQKETGYYYKQGFSEFYHADSQYCCRYNCETGQYEWIFDPDWSNTHGCFCDLNVYKLLKELVDRIDDLEPGEILDFDSSPASCSHELDEIEEIRRCEDEIDPCIRIVLQTFENNNSTASFVELYIVTIQGAIVGSSSDCDIWIYDDNLVKDKHCQIRYDSSSKSYSLISLVEEETIFVNNVLLGSTDKILHHQDRIIIGNTHFLFHIHKGTNTCAKCEPGLQKVDNNSSSVIVPLTKKRKERLRQKELKAMKLKYGLTSEVDTEKRHECSSNYVDRSKLRRSTVGSEGYVNDCRPVETASVIKPVSSTNKGYKLLAKMGWKEGDGLGRRDDGIKEPVCSFSHIGSGGIGSDTSSKVMVGDQQDAQKRMKWLKTKERFVKLPQAIPDQFNEDA